MGLLAGYAGGCTRIEVTGQPEAETAEPVIRVGLAVDRPSVTVGGGDWLMLSAPDGGGLMEVVEGSTATVIAGQGGLRVRLGGVTTSSVTAVRIRPRDTADLVRVEGRDYRGEVLVTTTASGIAAVNVVGLEQYVVGVIGVEMGRRPVEDREALLAQAVVSRTLAIRSLGRYRVRGYDLAGTVADQVYGGAAAETDLAWESVRATRGQVLTYGGTLIEAFFSSTCGGRTAAVEEAFSGGAQPYLRSISDRDAAGEAYCAASPRFRWREEWTGDGLAAALVATRQTSGMSGDVAVGVTDLAIASRTISGRVAEVMVSSGTRSHVVSGQNAIRQTLRPTAGGMLRSNHFTIQASRGGGKIVRLVISGGGSGHGVGMCQWGAFGRARAGFSYRDILSAYFPGTEIRRFF